MNSETLALLIPIFALMIPLMAIWTTHQRKVEEIRASAANDRAAQAAAQTAVLEERVRVLERIITDRGHALADEIEALRTDVKVPAPVTPKALQ